MFFWFFEQLRMQICRIEFSSSFVSSSAPLTGAVTYPSSVFSSIHHLNSSPPQLLKFPLSAHVVTSASLRKQVHNSSFHKHQTCTHPPRSPPRSQQSTTAIHFLHPVNPSFKSRSRLPTEIHFLHPVNPSFKSLTQICL